MTRHWTSLLLTSACCALLALPAQGDKDAKEDPAHDELRAVRAGLTEAVNKGDRDKLIAYLHKNVVVTWLNGEVSRGPEEVKAYYDRMMTGDKKVVSSISIHPEATRLSDLYGNTAVVSGHSDDDFRLTSGLEFRVHSLWSATLIKEDDKWQVVNFHASTNMFDNPLLNAAQKTAYIAGGVAGGVGLLLGLIAGRFLGKKTP